MSVLEYYQDDMKDWGWIELVRLCGPLWDEAMQKRDFFGETWA